MKRIGNLYEKVIAIDNLKLADEKARKGKLHSYGVQQHDKNREANILALHESLKMELSRHPNITFSQFLNQRNVKSINCHIIPTASCIMR